MDRRLCPGMLTISAKCMAEAKKSDIWVRAQTLKKSRVDSQGLPVGSSLA